MKKYTRDAIKHTNVLKDQRKEEYLSRKSMHIRVLPDTYKEIRMLAIEENVTVQGCVEYFMCLLIDNDARAKELIFEYKEALKRKRVFMCDSDAKSIMDAIEAMSPLNDD